MITGRGSRDWMLTFSGVAYYPADPRVEDVRIVDIAHHLSMLCRYAGACRKFYSVAEHSVLVSHIVPPDLALEGLLHDATEAYVNDIVSPIKRNWLMWGYRRLEARNWKVIAKKFGLSEHLHPSTHRADIAVLRAEQNELMVPLPQSQGFKIEAAKVPIQCWTPEAAEAMFLDRFYELTRGRGYVIGREDNEPLISAECCAA